MKYLAFFLFTFISLGVNAQTDKATTQRIVEAKNFIFVASSAIPMNSVEINAILSKMPGANSGANMNLSGSNYNVRITPDSLISYLPYFGRSFKAPIAQDEAGYQFTSTKFTFEKSVNKKGGWQISINTQDTREGVRMSFIITNNGYASLTVNSNNKQSISYYGYLATPKKTGI